MKTTKEFFQVMDHEGNYVNHFPTLTELKSWIKKEKAGDDFWELKEGFRMQRVEFV